MDIMRKYLSRTLLAMSVLVVLAASSASAQDFPAVRIIAKGANGYMAVVGRDTMLIITQQLVDSVALWHSELKALRRENDLQKRAIAAHEQASTALEKARGDAKNLIDELQFQRDGYKSLAEGYKKLNAPRTLSLEGGFGASGSETKPALFFGLGWSRLRFYTLLQESNVGGFVGANFPIF
jgi:hypothetical protein